MTVETPRRIAGFKRTTWWTLGLVQALLFCAMSSWLFLGSRAGEWYHALFAVGWLGAAGLYGAMLRNERRDFSELN